MKKLKKSGFIEGAFIATFCIIVTKILGILYVIPFYKIIGEQGGTLYGYAYNIYNIFLIISSAGIPLAISKLTSEYQALNQQEKKIRMYELASKIIMIFSVVSFLICFIFAKQLSKIIIGELVGGNTIEDVTFVIRLISFALLVIPSLSIKRGYLQGHTYIKEPSISQIIEQIVRISIIIIGSYLSVYVFKLPIKYAVGISVFAACLGGIATYIYLTVIAIKNKKQINLDKKVTSTKEIDKEIIKKVVAYSIPFIAINLANTIYTFIDMVLIIRTLPKLGFTAPDTEFVTSVFTTWGVKFNTIVTSISTGLIISLIPNMVHDYTERNLKAVNNNFNKCLKIIILIITPLAIFISVMSQSIWQIFYGANKIGPLIIKYSIIVTIFDSLYMIVNSLNQSLNKTKLIYTNIILGLLINLILDIPLMTLFYHINIPAYYGAITASLIGLIASSIVSIKYLNKEIHFEYTETIKLIPNVIISIILLIVVLNVMKIVLPINNPSRIVQVINIATSGIISAGIYLIINFKSILEIIPEKLLKKLKLSN